MPRISACLITRDEAPMLPDCLASLRGVADEVIVVDTGSTDSTMAIARAAGAIVGEVAWQDDFSAARNASLARATGEWILVIDADERLAPTAEGAVRRALVSADFDCGMLPLHQATRAGASLTEILGGAARAGEPSYLPRLLRRTPDLRFEGIIHESVLPWLAARGMRLAFIEAPIIHLGGTREVRESKHKSDRNIGLLVQAAAMAPDDFTPLGYLAHEYLEAGRREEAIAVIDRGWALVERGDRPRRASVLRLATARGRVLLEAGDVVKLRATLDLATSIEGAHPDLDFFRGAANELDALSSYVPRARRAHLIAALAHYRSARQKRTTRYAQAFVSGASSWAAETRIGAVELALGRPAEARAAFTRALARRAGHREAALGLVECDLDVGRPEAALAAIEPLLDDRPDPWLLAAAAVEQLGMLRDFRTFLAKARERAPRGYLSPYRRERHAVLHALLATYLGKPLAGPGPVGALCAVLGGLPLLHPEAAPFLLDATRVSTLVANLARAGQLDRVTALLDARAEQVMPGVGAAVTKAAGAIGVRLDTAPAALIA